MAAPTPLFAVTSANVPLPVLRNRLVAAERGDQQIDVAVVVEIRGGAPRPYIATASPACFVMSVNVPLRLLR